MRVGDDEGADDGIRGRGDKGDDEGGGDALGVGQVVLGDDGEDCDGDGDGEDGADPPEDVGDEEPGVAAP